MSGFIGVMGFLFISSLIAFVVVWLGKRAESRIKVDTLNNVKRNGSIA
jgi:hypothetical protein